MARIPENEAIGFVRDVLKTKDINDRVRKTEDFLMLFWKGKLPGLTSRLEVALDNLIDQCLSDCIATGKSAQGLRLLCKSSFSANQQKRFLDSAVRVFLMSGKTREALGWIEDVVYVFGKKSVLHLANKPEFKALYALKGFQKIVGPGAEKKRLKEDINEIINMWKTDEYDNIKDAVLDARNAVKDAQRLKSPLIEKARKHLDVVTNEAKRMMAADPEIKKYMKGLA